MTRGKRPTASQFGSEIHNFYPKMCLTTKGNMQEVWQREVDKASRELRLCDAWAGQKGITEEEMKEQGLYPGGSAV